MENGKPVYTEEGNARDLMLLPSGVSLQPGASLNSMDEESQPAAAAANPGQLDYQIMCHVGNTEATQILRLPVVLPAKDSSESGCGYSREGGLGRVQGHSERGVAAPIRQINFIYVVPHPISSSDAAVLNPCCLECTPSDVPGDRRVLCKFVVMLDGIKLEPRQFPVVVGSAAELGAWNAGEGVKLMRQVGGYWTRRVELPLYEGSGDIQAKVSEHRSGWERRLGRSGLGGGLGWVGFGMEGGVG